MDQMPGDAERTSREAAASPPSAAARGFLEGLIPVVVLLALVCHPTQVTVRQWADALTRLVGFGHGVARLVPAVGVCVSDVLLIVAFGLWAIVNLRKGRILDRLRSYPAPLLALLICAVLSVVPFLKPSGLFTGRQLLYGRAAKEFVQLFIFFACGFLVLTDCMRDAAWRRRLAAGFFCAAAFAILVGMWEYARLRPYPAGGGTAGELVSPVRVDATFGFRAEAAGPHEQIGTSSNRSVLGAWASLVAPLLWGLALCLKKRPLRTACGVGAAASLPLLLHGGLWFVTMAALLVVAFVRGGKAFAATAAGLFVFWALLFHFAPQQHGMVLLDSLMLRKSYDRYHTLSLYGEMGGSGEVVPPAVLSEEDNGVWQQKFLEWQPGLQAVARNPLFGVGLGNYQNNINNYYEAHPHPFYNPDGVYGVTKPVKNLMEAGGNSFYLVWLVETGFVGLFALLWVLLFGLRSAAGAWRAGRGGLDAGLALGAVGALCAMAGGMLFTNYLVRGVGVAVVFVLATAATAVRR